jgi:hypothetical protein
MLGAMSAPSPAPSPAPAPTPRLEPAKAENDPSRKLPPRPTKRLVAKGPLVCAACGRKTRRGMAAYMMEYRASKAAGKTMAKHIAAKRAAAEREALGLPPKPPKRPKPKRRWPGTWMERRMKETMLRTGLPFLPPRIRDLPIDERGYPVPWFVGWIDGKPDFRVIRPDGMAEAIRKHICWLCGQPLGRFLTFVIGPMCAITRTTAEPPSHRQCAEFAVLACPFLTNPNMVRSPRAKPEGADEPAGVHIPRNPGVSAVWTARNYKRFRVEADVAGSKGGYLIEMGNPERVSWWREGRKATREEVEASIAGGFPTLEALAVEEGRGAVAALSLRVAAMRSLLPAASEPVADEVTP